MYPKFVHFIVKNLIISWAFIRIIIFYKVGGGCLLKATVFDNSWKNLYIYQFSLDDCHIDIRNVSLY